MAKIKQPDSHKESDKTEQLKWAETACDFLLLFCLCKAFDIKVMLDLWFGKCFLFLYTLKEFVWDGTINLHNHLADLPWWLRQFGTVWLFNFGHLGVYGNDIS